MSLDNNHVTNLGQGFCLFPAKVFAMAITEEPILSRLDRLDNMVSLSTVDFESFEMYSINYIG